jgi:hypothetical protein
MAVVPYRSGYSPGYLFHYLVLRFPQVLDERGLAVPELAGKLRCACSPRVLVIPGTDSRGQDEPLLLRPFKSPPFLRITEKKISLNARFMVFFADTEG